MALPASGEISARQINQELGRSTSAELSIDTAENGGYATINQASPSRPNSSNPASYSEWYSYNHTVGSTPTYVPLEFGFSGGSFDDACRFFPGRTIDVWGIDPFGPANWYFDGVEIFQPGRGGFAFAPAGFYSRDDFYRQWGGSSWIGEIEECRI
jgi:hypothetical protein